MNQGSAESIRKPSILKPYSGPADNHTAQDIFVCLRPSSNGVLVESKLMKVIEADPYYRKDFWLVYLANLPGDFMTHHHVIERNYVLRHLFALHGIRFFTDKMKTRLEAWLKEPIADAEICGAFEAMDLLSYSAEELFQTWVAPADLLKVNGQSVKRIHREGKKPLYVINYDIPALLKMNCKETDIAVMLFRTLRGHKHFAGVTARMKKILLEHKIMDEHTPANRILHVSKSPCEELIDGSGYLYTPEHEPVPYREINFGNYLLKHGKTEEDIQEIVKRPTLLTAGGKEKTYFELTCECTYDEALARMNSITKKEVFQYDNEQYY